MKIIKTVATSCQILKLKCIKFDLGAGELTTLPQTLAGYNGPTSNGDIADDL